MLKSINIVTQLFREISTGEGPKLRALDIHYNHILLFDTEHDRLLCVKDSARIGGDSSCSKKPYNATFCIDGYNRPYIIEYIVKPSKEELISLCKRR